VRILAAADFSFWSPADESSPRSEVPHGFPDKGTNPCRHTLQSVISLNIKAISEHFHAFGWLERPLAECGQVSISSPSWAATNLVEQEHAIVVTRSP